MGIAAIGFMLGTGGSAIVAKTLGEGKKEKANQYFSMILYFGIIVSVIFSVICFIFTPQIARMLKADGELLEHCIVYGRILFATQTAFIMQLYENARAFMREHGNPGQWGTTYPPQNMIETDIRFGNLYVCIEKDTIEAVFFYKDGIDTTYLKIYDGQWKNDAPYGVVHRITSSGKVKGAASFCLDWAFSQCG